MVLALTLAGCGGDTTRDASAAGSGGGIGSGGVLGNEGGTAGTLACDAPTQVFQVSCALAACHDAVTRQAQLDLSGDPYAALLNKAPAPNVAGVTFCADSGYLMIDSRQPERSLLYLKQQYTPPCGVGMPFPLGPTTARRKLRVELDSVAGPVIHGLNVGGFTTFMTGGTRRSARMSALRSSSVRPL